MTRPDDLAAHCIRDVLRKTPALDSSEIEDVVIGCAQPHGPQGQNVAHLVALAFAVAASANLPVVLLTLYWKRCNTGGVVAGLVIGANRFIAQAFEPYLYYLSPTPKIVDLPILPR